MRDVPASEKLLRRIEWVTAILLPLFCFAAWVMFSAQWALGVFLGGCIAVLSFQALKWQLRRAFQEPGKVPAKAGLFAAYYLRFLGTLFVIFTVLYYGWADPIPFLVGLSVKVLSIVLVGGFEFIRMAAKKGES